jgi:putative zinc finger protein
MKTTCPDDGLEALARGELAPLPAQRLLAHLRGCATCRDELAWLRAERLLADEHAREDEPLRPEIWRAVAGRVGPAGGRRAPFALRPAPALAFVALAAALAIVSWRRSHTGAPAPAGNLVLPEPPAASSPAVDSAAPEPVALKALNVSKPVARPTTLSLSVGDATVDVGLCGGSYVNVTVSDTRHDAIALDARPGAGGRGERVELRVDGGSLLESGQARILVPRGTRLEVTTAAGEQFVTEVTAPTRVVGAARATPEPAAAPPPARPLSPLRHPRSHDP